MNSLIVSYMKYKDNHSYEVTLAVNNECNCSVLGSRLVSVLSDHVQFPSSHSRVIALKTLLGWLYTSYTRCTMHLQDCMQYSKKEFSMVSRYCCTIMVANYSATAASQTHSHVYLFI